jgi:hypothetical protein
LIPLFNAFSLYLLISQNDGGLFPNKACNFRREQNGFYVQAQNGGQFDEGCDPLAVAQHDLMSSPPNDQEFEVKPSAQVRNATQLQTTSEESMGEYTFGTVDFTPVGIEDLSELEDFLAPLG